MGRIYNGQHGFIRSCCCEGQLVIEYQTFPTMLTIEREVNNCSNAYDLVSLDSVLIKSERNPYNRYFSK